jgi:endonuclease/exonuclease/phosphatase family metal-dependent hydrolase
MNKLNCIFFFVFGLNLNSVAAQNFPKLGNDTLLDVACWNVEWFGDTGNGPSDETTQFNNVKALLDKTELDVLGLCEISNLTSYNNLSTQLSSKYETYISTFSATQKMALYWRKNMFDVIGFETLNILASENYTFASRPPLQVCLKTKTGNKTDTIYFITVHLKAISDLDSYNRRKAASALLKSYVESALKGKKYIILGDWNDDLDASTYQLAETPFKNFLDAKYTFPSKELTDAGKSSYAFNTNMIDHIMNSKTLDSFYVKGSARVFDNAATYAVNFSNTTSDHWPVYAFYDWKKLTTLNIPIGNESYERLAEVKVWPNPFSNDITIQLGAPEFMVRLFDMKGSLVYEEDIKQNEKTINTDGLSSGIYVISVNQNGQTFRAKMIK